MIPPGNGKWRLPCSRQIALNSKSFQTSIRMEALKLFGSMRCAIDQLVTSLSLSLRSFGVCLLTLHLAALPIALGTRPPQPQGTALSPGFEPASAKNGPIPTIPLSPGLVGESFVSGPCPRISPHEDLCRRIRIPQTLIWEPLSTGRSNRSRQPGRAGTTHRNLLI
jgi:hypothetical protein